MNIISKEAIIIFIHTSIGRGKSKKEAKRLAAHQMWQRLQDLPVDSQDETTDDVSKTHLKYCVTARENLFKIMRDYYNSVL